MLGAGGCVSLPSGPVTDTAVRSLSCFGADCSQRPPTVGTYVQGRVVTSGPLKEEPVAFTRLILLRRGIVAATTTSDKSGAFFFRNVSDGIYDLVLDSDRYDARLNLDVSGNQKGLVLVAQPRATAVR